MKKWFLYIIRCENNSLYTGITTDLERRFQEHLIGKGAKYTRMFKPVEVVFFVEVENRKEASRLESKIKNLTKAQKEKICLQKRIILSEIESKGVESV